MDDFDWMQTTARLNRPDTVVTTRDDEIKRRATTMARLGYSQKKAEKRLRANLTWEYEHVGKPAALKRLPGLVAEAYRRAGRAPAAPAKKKR